MNRSQRTVWFDARAGLTTSDTNPVADFGSARIAAADGVGPNLVQALGEHLPLGRLAGAVRTVKDQKLALKLGG